MAKPWQQVTGIGCNGWRQLGIQFSIPTLSSFSLSIGGEVGMTTAPSSMVSTAAPLASAAEGTTMQWIEGEGR